SIGDVRLIFTRIFTEAPAAIWRAMDARSLAPLGIATGNLGLSQFDLLLAVAGVIILMTVEFLQGRRPLRPALAALPGWARWAAYYAAVASILLFGKFTSQQFIYFQF
ncbi:MAG: hypothetical protein M3Y07_12490, partial [Acidobacteriota bacterium]|nr:hypothetical protein [Acidobacteriota bacterium]